MDDKERVLTLASASRMTGVEQKKLQSMIDEGKLEAVKTEGGNLLISESSLKLILEESQIIETSHSENILSEDVKKLLSQAAFFIERQESELKTYKERERKQISLLEGAEVHINKFLDQLNELQKQNISLSNENRDLLKTLMELKIKKGKEELFEKIFVELSKNVREIEKGNIFYQISKDREIENTYIVMEQYIDQESVDAHGKSDHFKAAGAKLAECLDGAPVIKRLDSIS